MSEFKIGDRVRCTGGHYASKGDEGYVFGYYYDSPSTPFIVFDRPQGHAAVGTCVPDNTKGYLGWYMSNSNLELINELSNIPEPDFDDLI